MIIVIARLQRIIIRGLGLLTIVGLFYGSSYPGVITPSEANPATAAISPFQIGQAVADSTAPSAPSNRIGWVDWNGDNFFGPCRGDCAISLYGGKEVTTSMERIFFIKYPAKLLPDWNWRGTYLAAGTFSRRLVTFMDVLSLEPEFGVGQRFGQMHATEFWGALNIRWIAFPWNDYIRTSIGLADGLSIATKIDSKERLLNNYRVVNNKLVFSGSHVMNFFTPELTLALPKYPDYELLFRFHHRSGVYGLIDDTHAGAQFFAVGFRTRF
jgi:hypothetical protein